MINDSDMDISVDSIPAAANQATKEAQPMEHTLLLPPIINATGAIATGATTKTLRKQNKIQLNKTLSKQDITSQWARHNGETILDLGHWEQRTKKAEVREMAPHGLALQHEAADIYLLIGRSLGALLKQDAIGVWQKSKRQSTADRTSPRSNQTPLHILQRKWQIR